MSTTTTPQTITDYADTRIEYIARHGGPRRKITTAEWNAYRYAAQHPDTRDTRTYRQETGNYTADARHIRRGLANAHAEEDHPVVDFTPTITGR